MSKDEKPSGKDEAAKPVAPKRAFQAPPKPHGGFPDKGGKGGKSNTPKGRIFRHQGR